MTYRKEDCRCPNWELEPRCPRCTRRPFWRSGWLLCERGNGQIVGKVSRRSLKCKHSGMIGMGETETSSREKFMLPHPAYLNWRYRPFRGQLRCMTSLGRSCATPQFGTMTPADHPFGNLEGGFKRKQGQGAGGGPWLDKGGLGRGRVVV